MGAQPPLRILFLTGFMGAGKTSVGRALAARLGWRFVDLDERVEQQAGRRITEIFRDSGEAEFRSAEIAAVHELLQQQATAHATVAALGGGTLTQPQNAERLRQAGGILVFLDAPLEVLRQRCQPMASLRPLFGDEAAFQKLYESRLADYRRASLRVNTANRTPEEVAAEIAMALNLNPTDEIYRR
ncbi:MAG TPA: shikimate kinase [Terriglobales bacterium]|nr:shikimate kinase [Terriglobales bacterium]